MNLVFIDDSADNLNLFKIYLKGLDYSIQYFSSPQEGLDYLLNNEVDLCFLDIQMPSMSGDDLLVEYKKKCLEDKKIPCSVIALTGTTTDRELTEFKNIGFTKVLIKPILKAKMIEVIEEFEN
ncbi:response regulator [Halobacteriovorax sp. GB3]|uniref:response regulator n=1 Tax=Halobacteriovorax sp. GB3 TaxID=2719615 RepID=UPI0023624201|nr:response regulator [Halobacteriovorax sp. GB3]MDD0853490.1 response regulator [Halobacteriovorax sp. GB3]